MFARRVPSRPVRTLLRRSTQRVVVQQQHHHHHHPWQPATADIVSAQCVHTVQMTRRRVLSQETQSRSSHVAWASVDSVCGTPRGWVVQRHELHTQVCPLRGPSRPRRNFNLRQNLANWLSRRKEQRSLQALEETKTAELLRSQEESKSGANPLTTTDPLEESPNHWKVAVVDGSGKISIEFLEKRTASQVLGVQLRDLRLLDPKSGSRSISSIYFRGKSTVVKAEYVRAVIQATDEPKGEGDHAESESARVVLFDAENVNVRRLARELTVYLSRRAHGRLEEGSQVSFLPANAAYTDTVLDIVLHRITADYEGRYHIVNPVVQGVLRHLALADVDAAFMRLLPIKRVLATFTTNLSEFRGALIAAGEYVAAMRADDGVETNQMQLIEMHMRNVEELNNELNELEENIASTQKALSISLDSTRNKLMRLNIQLTITTLALAAGSLIAGIMGMNLPHGLEEDPTAFATALLGIGVVGVGLYGIGAYFYVRSWATPHIIKDSGAMAEFYNNLNSPSFINRLSRRSNQEDFARFLTVVVGKRVQQDWVDEIFQEHDIDLDGELSMEEFLDAIKNVDPSVVNTRGRLTRAQEALQVEHIDH